MYNSTVLAGVRVPVRRHSNRLYNYEEVDITKLCFNLFLSTQNCCYWSRFGKGLPYHCTYMRYAHAQDLGSKQKRDCTARPQEVNKRDAVVNVDQF